MEFKPFHRPRTDSKKKKKQIGISFYGNLQMQSEQISEMKRNETNENGRLKKREKVTKN